MKFNTNFKSIVSQVQEYIHKNAAVAVSHSFNYMEECTLQPYVCTEAKLNEDDSIMFTFANNKNKTKCALTIYNPKHE